MIYLVFSIQFFNLPCLFAKFYWYILTVDKYFIFSALSFLQTEGLRKCKKDHAKCLTTYDEISRWNSKRIRRTYYQYERKISAQVAFVSTEISKKEKREFSHSIPRHDSMWMFMILLYVPVTILYDIYIGTVCQKLSICCESEVFLIIFFAREKQLIYCLSFSLLTLIKAYLEFKYKRNFV